MGQLNWEHTTVYFGADTGISQGISDRMISNISVFRKPKEFLSKQFSSLSKELLATRQDSNA